MAKQQPDAVELDVFDPDFIRCPFPAYHRLQAADAAAYVAHGKGFWFVTRHDLVREVAGDADRFSSESGPLGTTSPSPAAMARMASTLTARSVNNFRSISASSGFFWDASA